jgi:hypothetical protein
MRPHASAVSGIAQKEKPKKGGACLQGSNDGWHSRNIRVPKGGRTGRQNMQDYLA